MVFNFEGENETNDSEKKKRNFFEKKKKLKFLGRKFRPAYRIGFQPAIEFYYIDVYNLHLPPFFPRRKINRGKKSTSTRKNCSPYLFFFLLFWRLCGMFDFELKRKRFEKKNVAYVPVDKKRENNRKCKKNNERERDCGLLYNSETRNLRVQPPVHRDRPLKARPPSPVHWWRRPCYRRYHFPPVLSNEKINIWETETRVFEGEFHLNAFERSLVATW